MQLIRQLVFGKFSKINRKKLEDEWRNSFVIVTKKGRGGKKKKKFAFRSAPDKISRFRLSLPCRGRRQKENKEVQLRSGRSSIGIVRTTDKESFVFRNGFGGGGTRSKSQLNCLEAFIIRRKERVTSAYHFLVNLVLTR